MTRRSTLGGKITLLVILTSASAILLVSMGLATNNHANLKRTAYSALEAQATIAAVNSAAPMAFQDRDTAREVLSGFRALPSVSSARLYDTFERPFALYTSPGGAEPRSTLLNDGEHTVDGHYVVVVPVGERDERYGTLQVVYELSPLRRELARNLLLAAAICALALLLSAAVARKGAAVLVRRLALLDATARRVSETKDYSVRAQVLGQDEIGRFTATFNDMLAQIQDQDEALRASRQQALQASRLKDDFLATISHELRTPMTPIAGWAQILRQLAQGNPPVLEAAAVIERNATAMTRIIDDLLDMSRIISGKVRLDVSTFNLGELVRDATGAVQQAADAKGILLTSRIDPTLSMRADPQRLQQVLWNLLTNAVKFTTTGGVVDVAVARGVDAIELVVSDTGAGIEPEFLPYVFDRFRQADSSATRRHGGLGLGLAIARQLVELHGGEIEVHSVGLGEGASFTVRLPARLVVESANPDASRTAGDAENQGDAATPDGTPTQPPALDLLHLRVLSVEDDHDARAWLQQVFRNAGADVASASSAAEALTMLDTFQPDVVVSDIGMPDRDGYQLIQDIRSRGPAHGGRVPALALTAFARADDRNRAIDAGFDAHLGKPVDAALLIQRVAQLAQRARRDSTPVA